jgi:hypothetical protein
MSEEIGVAVKTPESLGAVSEESGYPPEINESIQVFCEIGATLRRQPITDFAAAVLAEQLECLRRTTADLDGQYASNVKRRRMKFKDQVAYLALRERIATRIVALAERLCQLRSTDPATNAVGSESERNWSWDPDDPGSATFSPAAQ